MSQPSDENQPLQDFLEYPSENGFSLSGIFHKHPFQALLAVLGGGLFLISLIFLLKNIGQDSQVKIIPVEENQETSSAEILVHLAGAVQKPGVYRLPLDARVNDVLAAAGGLTEDANRNWFNKNINLAQKVSDGIKIYVPFENESGETVLGSASGLVNINTASQVELESLPKIGPVTASRIIDYRKSSGQFQSVEDLTKVTGISQKTVDNIRNLITIF